MLDAGFRSWMLYARRWTLSVKGEVGVSSKFEFRSVCEEFSKREQQKRAWLVVCAVALR